MYAIRNAETGQYFQGLDTRRDPTFDTLLVKNTPKWKDFEECQAYILVNGLAICEVYTIPE